MSVSWSEVIPPTQPADPVWRPLAERARLRRIAELAIERQERRERGRAS